MQQNQQNRCKFRIVVLILTCLLSIAFKEKSYLQIKQNFNFRNICLNEKKNVIKSLLGSFLLIANINVNVCFANNNLNNISPVGKYRVEGKEKIEGESLRIFMKGRQCESDGEVDDALKFYQQVISVEPDFIYVWSNLGNVLVVQGNLDQALLCYKKAISLSPPKDTLSIILLNKASLELSLGKNKEALLDLDAAERISSPNPIITTNKAVAFSNQGDWKSASNLFESVISSADRYALPWWLRYSMSLLETSRGMESVAYLQRTLNRFPEEAECNAFATSLYTSLGSFEQAKSYWNKLSIEEKADYSNTNYLKEKVRWGPIAIKSFENFLTLKF